MSAVPASKNVRRARQEECPLGGERMRFDATMVARREAIVRLVREGLVSQVSAATELGVTPR